MTRKLLLPLTIALTLGACQDGIAPFGGADATRPQFDLLTDSSGEVHFLRQSPSAPPLETYRVSFWAGPLRTTAVTVRYRPAAGQSVGDPFLRFEIPKHGVVAGGGGAPLGPQDSVLVTLTIDSVAFRVDFQPGGVAFSPAYPARLTLWYANANPDLNGDGQVGTLDAQLEQQLAVWYHGAKWSRVSSRTDPAFRNVAANLYHFSEYAVSW
jgi:hypothetical protein